MLTRRTLLAGAAGRAIPRKTVAAVVTEYRHYSHADVVIGRLLGGYSADGRHTSPRTQVVSLYTDQVPQGTDMSRDLAARFGFKIYPTIREALTLGGSRLAVDAVAFVGEHGNYPTNELGQKLYPRFELFQQILDVYEQSGRVVPTFFDKHLSYSWEKANTLYQRARKLGVPMLAGSSIPVTPRTPPLEIPLDTPIDRAVCLGNGDLDAYGFHLLESMQCMLERRQGGETGVASVEMLQCDAVWRWRDSDSGAWSKPLLEAALKAGVKPEPAPLEQARKPALFLIKYRDGLEAAGFMVTKDPNDRMFAARVPGRPDPLTTYFGPAKPDRPLPHFDGLVKCVEDLFVTGKPPYPVERTLLTTGILAFLFESKKRAARVDTPELDIHYRSPVKCYVQKA